MKLTLPLLITFGLSIPTKAIYNGTSVTVEDYPRYVVGLYRNPDRSFSRASCTGVLISPRHILTAASCVNTASTHYSSVSINTVEAIPSDRKHTDIFDWKELYWPEYYERRNYYGNVGIVIIKDQQKVTEFAKLPKSTKVMPADGDNVTVMGYGMVDEGNLRSYDLKKFTTTVVDNESCENQMKDYREVSRDKFCGEGCLSSTCRGDEGGPVFWNGMVVGIVSNKGDTCGGEKCYPSVFTPVGPNLAWISRTVRRHK